MKMIDFTPYKIDTPYKFIISQIISQRRSSNYIICPKCGMEIKKSTEIVECPRCKSKIKIIKVKKELENE